LNFNKNLPACHVLTIGQADKLSRGGTTKMIGVIGGVGPYAGLDLLRKILEQTEAQSDQDHLAVISISQPASITDRTAFLVGETALNPARPILEQLYQLEKLGATVAGIPCNTAHAAPIMDVIERELAASSSRLHLLNMIEEVGRFLLRHFPTVETVGLLSTTGTSNSRVYPQTLEPLGLQVIEAREQAVKEMVHRAIYDSLYGIKARGYATEKARGNVLSAVNHLGERGAEAVILGCTELPLALPEREINGLPLIDSTLALARALIRAVDPQKLRSWEDPVYRGE
jgi:aspartate racemase